MADADDFFSLPLADRLHHKNWKARVSAYEELSKDFGINRSSLNNTVFSRYASDLRKIVADPHLAAQEAALTTVILYLECSPVQNSSRVLRELLSVLAEKTFSCARASTRSKSTEIFLLAVEILESGDLVMETILESLAAKLPRTVVQAIATVREVVISFGVQTVNIKILLKNLSKLFGNSDKTVRSESASLVVTLYQFIGPAIMPFLSDLKELQLRELEDLFKQTKGLRLSPSRMTRSQKSAAEAEMNAQFIQAELELLPAADNHNISNHMGLVDEVLEQDFSEPEDVLKNLPSSFYDDLGSQKWKERVSAVESLLPLIVNKRLKEGRYGDLISALSKKINDINLNVSLLCIQAIENIALGLKTEFGSYRCIVVPNLFEKTKERKTNILEAIRRALDAIFLCTSLESNLDDITSAHLQKNPQVRTEALRFLNRCLRIMRILPSKAEVKIITKILEKTIDDGVIEVRDSSAECIGTLMKLVGERSIAPFFDKIDQIKQAKVKEFFANAVVNVSITPVVIAQPPIMSNLIKNQSVTTKKSIATTSNNSNSAQQMQDNSQKYATTKKNVSRPNLNESSPQISVENEFNYAESSNNINNKNNKTNSTMFSPPQNDMAIINVDPRLKQKRSSEDRGSHKWTLEGLKFDLVDFLKEQASSCFTPPLVALLFSSGHYKEREHVQGLTLLHEFVVEKQPGCIVHADVILKYISLRFQDSNTTILLKSFEIAEGLFQLLTENSYQLSDYEASSFIPFLFLKTGDSKEIIRSRSRGLLSSISYLYSPAKLFLFALKATESKNSRIRAECLDEIGELILRFGIGCCQQKSLPNIAGFIGERDPLVRNAALDTLVKVARAVGEAQLYSLIGRISDKDKGLLEQRIKRSGNLVPTENTTTFTVQSNIERNTPLGVSSEAMEVDLNDTPDHSQKNSLVAEIITETIGSNIPLSSDILPHAQFPINQNYDPCNSDLMNYQIQQQNMQQNSQNQQYLQQQYQFNGQTPLSQNYQQQQFQMQQQQQQQQQQDQNHQFMMQQQYQNQLHQSQSQQQRTTPMHQQFQHPVQYANYSQRQTPQNQQMQSEQYNTGQMIQNHYFQQQPNYSATHQNSSPSRPQLHSSTGYGGHLNQPHYFGRGVPQPGGAFVLTPEKVGITQFSRKYDNINRSENLVEYVVTKVASEVPSEALDAIRQIEKLLVSQPLLLRDHIEGLVKSFALALHIGFGSTDYSESLRVCRHMISALLQLVDVTELAKLIPVETLEQLMCQLLIQILDTGIASRYGVHGPGITKALNMLMVRIIERMPQNNVYAVLLQILSDSMQRLNTPELVRFAELTMKCLWKAIRTISEQLSANRIIVGILMKDINLFLEKIHMTEMRGRATPLGDVPIRTIKTILSELTNFYGNSIMNNFDLIPNPLESHVYMYTQQLLNQSRRKSMAVSNLQPDEESLKTPTSISNNNPAEADCQSQNGVIPPTEVSNITFSRPIPPANVIYPINNQQNERLTPVISLSPQQNGFSAQRLAELGSIFSKIGSKQQSKQGISELYFFQQANPDLREEVEQRVLGTGPYFQTYIRRNLQLLEKEEPPALRHPPTPVCESLPYRHDLQEKIPHSAGNGGEKSFLRSSLLENQLTGEKLNGSNDDLQGNNFGITSSNETMVTGMPSNCNKSDLFSNLAQTVEHSNAEFLQQQRNLSFENLAPSNTKSATVVTQLRERLALMKMNLYKTGPK